MTDGFKDVPEIVDMHFESDNFKEVQSQGKKWHDAGLYVWYEETEEEIYRIAASNTTATNWGTYQQPDGPMLFFLSDSMAPVTRRAQLWATEGILVHGTSQLARGEKEVYMLQAEIPSRKVISRKE